jgi:hypothetical protein
MKRAGALLLALFLPVASLAAQDLQPFKATYSIRWNGMPAATGELELERLPEGRWAYHSRVRARLLARVKIPANQVQRSEFHIVDHRVVPLSFTSSDDPRQQIAFDWEAGRITGTLDGKALDLPTQPGLLDPLSAQVALMQELLSGRVPARFVLVDEDRIKDYQYAVESSEEIQSVAGTHRADIFSSRRPGSRKATFFWCAPDLGYIPLKVERRDGRTVQLTMTLTSLER